MRKLPPIFAAALSGLLIVMLAYETVGYAAAVPIAPSLIEAARTYPGLFTFAHTLVLFQIPAAAMAIVVSGLFFRRIQGTSPLLVIACTGPWLLMVFGEWLMDYERVYRNASSDFFLGFATLLGPICVPVGVLIGSRFAMVLRSG